MEEHSKSSETQSRESSKNATVLEGMSVGSYFLLRVEWTFCIKTVGGCGANNEISGPSGDENISELIVIRIHLRLWRLWKSLKILRNLDLVLLF